MKSSAPIPRGSSCDAFHLAWASNVPEAPRAAQLVADVVALGEDQAELELGLIWKDFSERHWQIGRIFDERLRRDRRGSGAFREQRLAGQAGA